MAAAVRAAAAVAAAPLRLMLVYLSMSVLKIEV